MRRLLALCGALGLASCAVTPQESVGPMSCAEVLQAADQAIVQAGVADGGSYRVPGFAWARSNRFLASFAQDLRPEQQSDWLQALRQLDREARQHEWVNLDSQEWPAAMQLEFDRCAHQAMQDLSSRDLESLRAAVAVPDDYSLTARTMGLYPLAKPFLALGVAAYQDEVLNRFKQPLPAAQGEWVEWSLDSQATAELPPSPATDALGRWRLSAVQWRTLLTQHAPSFLIDQQGAFDIPGQPGRAATGEGPSVMGSPTLYWYVSWTRYQDRVLPQLNYLLWFSQRPPESPLDFYAGALDGLVWRTTLDQGGQALVHDTIHACGCYHYIFPTQHLVRKPQARGQEPLLLPQGQVPFESISVVLESGTHYVQRVIPRMSAGHLRERSGRLALKAYADLLSLELADGHKRSLFQPDGLVAGSERLERYWLWPSGVISPGAMRQNGRHAIAFIGRRHFDDPFLLNSVFSEIP